MIANPVILRHQDAGIETPAFMLPEDVTFTPWEDYTECMVDGETRNLLTSAALMAARFNYNAAEREKLNHDCGVYALAVHGGESQEGYDFADPYTIDTEGLQLLSSTPTEPSSKSGDILLTSLRQPHERTFKTAHGDNFHYMIHASAPDEMPSLYFSKFGPKSPVLLHLFQTVVDFYGVQTIHSVGSMKRVHRTPQACDTIF